MTAPLPKAYRRLKGTVPQHLPKRLRWAVQTRKEGQSRECMGLSSTCTRPALGDGPPRASWAPSLGQSHQLLLKIRVSKCLMD